MTGCSYQEWRIVKPRLPIQSLLHRASKDAKFGFPGKIMISSMSDPYQPIEARLKLTQQILRMLLHYPKYQKLILTKSDLVKRDYKMLLDSRGKGREDVEVGFSIVTLKPTKLEPYAPSSV